MDDLETQSNADKTKIKICNEKEEKSQGCKIEAPLFQCKICGKTFTKADYLKTHEKIHGGEKSFECSTCNMKYAQKRYLTAHEKRHLLRNKSHKCDVCGNFTITLEI